MAANEYRPEIDGLRAVAVLAVILFHLGFSQLPGGFVGVDVFFVISGFLITGVLRREFLTSGSIDFRAFYLRRFLRLHPALLATVLATWIAAFWILGPSETQPFAQSMLSAAFSVSNIYFWQTAGYFDVQSAAKPLLHTWSLAVEEQFYLVWPLFVLWAAHRGRLPAMVALILATSFLANLIGLAGGAHSAVFYLVPFRMFELAIGAALSLLPHASAGFEKRKAVLLVAGMAMIAYAVTQFDQKMAFPSWSALVPCIGAALVILGGSGSLGRVVLGNPPAALVGALSYSLYLVHWPIVSFFHFLTFRGPDDGEKAALLAGTIAAAVALHYLVEHPFRWRRGPLPLRRVMGWGTALFVVTGIAAGSAWDGLLFRTPDETAEMLARTFDEAAKGRSGFLAEGCFTSGSSGSFSLEFNFEECLRLAPGAQNVLIAGDSSAAYAFGAMSEIATAEGIHLQQLTMSGCQPHIGPVDGPCIERNEWFFTHLEQFTGSRIVLMASWRPQSVGVMAETLETLKSAGFDVYLVGPSLSFSRALPGVVAASAGLTVGLARGANSIEQEALDIDAKLGAIAKVHDVPYFSIVDRLCPDRRRPGCLVMPEGSGVLVTFDTLHMPRSAALAIFKDAPFLH